MAELQIPITKAKGEFITIDVDAIPPDVFTEVVLQGLKTLLNRGTSKITKAAYPKEDELKSAAVDKAKEQLELVMSSKIKFTGQKKAAGVSGEVRTAAMQLARNIVKDELKGMGYKLSHIKASVITAAAKATLERMPELIETAKAQIEARKATKITGINLKELVQEDPELQAKAEAKKAKAGTLSAKQAGKVKTRAKGQGATA